METWAYLKDGAPLETVPLVNDILISFETPQGEIQRGYLIDWSKLSPFKREILWRDVQSRIPGANREEFYAECEAENLPIRKVRIDRVITTLDMREVV